MKKFLLGFSLLWLLLLPSTFARAEGPISATYFGVDDGGYVARSADNLALVKTMGASFVRIAMYWKWIEPANTTPENYNWAYPDSYLLPMRDAGVIPLIFITENPAWAATTSCGPIDTANESMRAEFSEFMGAMATRYSEVKIWILYNESDHSFGVSHNTGGCFGDHDTQDLNNNGVPDYADYAEMGALARTAVHQANPNAQVAFAVAFDDFDKGTCPSDYPGACPPASHFNYHFLPDLFGYIAAHPRPNDEPYADLLAYTYYDIYGPYWERQTSGAGWYGIQAKAAAIRARMSAAGISIPLFVTETGEGSEPQWIGLDGQSQCVVRNFVRAVGADLRAVTWWTFLDYPDKGWYFGVVDEAFVPKPSYLAYQVLTDQLRDASFLNRRKKPKLVEAHVFEQNGKRKWIAWSADLVRNGKAQCAAPRNPRALTLKAKRLKVTDMYGSSYVFRDNGKKDLDPRKGKMRLRVDGLPHYILVNP